MGYFIAYRHTGVDSVYLEQLLSVARDAFASAGIDIYCTFFDENEFQKQSMNPRQIMDHAFAKIELMDGLFVLIDGDEKSEGQLMEVGFSIARKIPLIVAKREGVSTYVDKMADDVFTYNDLDDLRQKIARICEVK